MTVTSDYEDIDELDEPEALDSTEPAAGAAEQPSKPGGQWTPKRKAVAAGVAGLAALVMLGRCGGDDAPKPAATTATSVTVNPLEGFPTLSPLVASTLRAEDVDWFANTVRTLTADGTSVCDVYYGVVADALANGEKRVRWALTTPKAQARSEVGVQLPSSKWPTRAFYGPPCNVVDDDVPLATTTTAPAASTTSTMTPAVKAG